MVAVNMDLGIKTKNVAWNTKMLATGHQLAAARALLGLLQETVAEAAGVSTNTIRNMEASGPKPIAGRAETVQRVQKALEKLGVEFIPENGGGPGIRLRKGT